MPIKIGTELPDLSGVTEWVNGTVSREELLGHPVMVHFWAVSCHTCSEQMPRVREIRQELEPRGLQVVGVHMPRSEADTDIARVKEAIGEYELSHPIAIDNMHEVTDRFENQFVPAFYIFDHEGHLRLSTAGEHAPKLARQTLERVLTKFSEVAQA